MPAIPPLVDQFGNINVHAREDIAVPIQGGDNGVGLSLADKAYFFEVFYDGKTVLRLALTADPLDSTRKLLVVTKDDLDRAKVPGTGASFVLFDETGSTPVSRWEGQLKRRGL